MIESCIDKNFGFHINGEKSIRDDAFLFGESPSRIIVSVSKSKENNFVKHLESEKVDFRLIGSVTSGTFSPILKIGIGLAYVDVNYLDNENIYIKIRDKFIMAKIVNTPF